MKDSVEFKIWYECWYDIESMTYRAAMKTEDFRAKRSRDKIQVCHLLTRWSCKSYKIFLRCNVLILKIEKIIILISHGHCVKWYRLTHLAMDDNEWIIHKWESCEVSKYKLPLPVQKDIYKSTTVDECYLLVYHYDGDRLEESLVYSRAYFCRI